MNEASSEPCLIICPSRIPLADIKEMENFMMERQQQLQNEMDSVKLNLRDIQASVLHHNFSAGNMFGSQVWVGRTEGT